ncbi:MAG TPA: hypothetical protein VKD91_04935 [Pyrinomonadaceae bacterium]|nr:hypothetical protein [Pyrinomonadaceae bacterium]
MSDLDTHTLIEFLIKIVWMALVMGFAFAIGFGLWRLVEIPLRKWRDSAFDYVYVDDDGNVRELNAAEEEFVSTAIFPNDDADRYIKSGYEALTADGRLAGYLQRRQLPREIPVAPAER